MTGLAVAPLLLPELEAKADIHPVIRRKAIRISVNNVVFRYTKRQARADRKIEVHPDIAVFAEVILEKGGKSEKPVGRARYVFHVLSLSLPEVAHLMLYAVNAFPGTKHGEIDPALRPFHELTIEANVKTSGVTL